MRLCGHDVGLDQKLFLIAGPCVIESRDMALRTAEKLKQIASKLNILLIYKSSFDKANRSSGATFRGPGMQAGLQILEEVKTTFELPILTDVHEITQIEPVAEVVDILQTPAFLARQTDFINSVASCGKPVNIKKAQFMAPHDMVNVVDKARAAAEKKGLNKNNFLVCERGASFGYNNLVSDMRSLAIMRATGCPVVFDATHSVQLPGGKGTSSGGQREFVPVLARAAIAVGVSGLFMECHPDPENALSDGPNAWPLDKLESLISLLMVLDSQVKEFGFSD